MQIDDLMRFPAGQPPTPYLFPLPLQRNGVWGSARLPEGWSLSAVGWLGSSVPTLGETPDACVDGLARAYDRGDRFTDGTAGWHDCEVCTTDEARYPDGQPGPIVVWRGQKKKLYGHGHYLVRDGSSVFMCPALILHYILDHGYQPPMGFVNAVVQGSFLTPADLVWQETGPSG